MARTHSFRYQINKFLVLITLVIFLSFKTLGFASIIVPMHLVTLSGQGKKIGYIKIDDTIYGLLLTPTLNHLSNKTYGWQIHTLPFCSNYAKASGGHFDPRNTEQHKGPYQGNGHLGDLPILMVQKEGKTTLPVLAPRLKLKDILGRSLVINNGEDNYSDSPFKNGGNNKALACGLIPYH